MKRFGIFSGDGASPSSKPKMAGDKRVPLVAGVLWYAHHRRTAAARRFVEGRINRPAQALRRIIGPRMVSVRSRCEPSGVQGEGYSLDSLTRMLRAGPD